MGLFIGILGLCLFMSVCLNVYLFIKSKTSHKEQSDDARRLIHDLTRGAALVRVIPIDPEGLYAFKR